MKKSILGLLLSLCLIGMAQAAEQTYGPDFARFTVDVPDGWTAKANDGGCQLISADQGTSLSIQVHKNGGKSASELAKLIGEQMGGKIVKMEEDGPNNASIYVEIDGVRVALLIAVDGDKFAAITMAGSDQEAMQKILATMKDAK